MGYQTIFHIREPRLQNRIELLDFLRGAAMLLVLTHHSDLPNNYGNWILAFHMPFMFLLSGYTMYLRPHPERFIDFVSGRFQRLVIPYFLFEGLNFFIWSASLYLQGGWQDVTEAATAILACLNTEGYTGYYGRLWFWPCMFVSDIYFYGILRFAPKKSLTRKVFLLAMIPAMFVLSWISCHVLPGRLPFTADTAFMATAFLLTGYLLGNQITWLIQKKHLLADITMLLISLLVMRLAVHSGKSECMMFINHYGHYGYTLCAAFSGMLSTTILIKFLYNILKKQNFLKSVVLWYGYHSLGTFPVHLSIKIFIYQMFPLSYRQWYILFPAMFLLSIPLVNLITTYFPFMLGKFSFRTKAKH